MTIPNRITPPAVPDIPSGFVTLDDLAATPYVKLLMAANQNIPNTDGTISLMTKLVLTATGGENNFSMWSSGANTRITIPTGMGGIYFLDAYVRTLVDASGQATNFWIGWLLNGGTSEIFHPNMVSENAGIDIIKASGPIRLAAGDYVEVVMGSDALTAGDVATTRSAIASTSSKPNKGNTRVHVAFLSK